MRSSQFKGVAIFFGTEFTLKYRLSQVRYAIMPPA
jgi:hypothetical protein